MLSDVGLFFCHVQHPFSLLKIASYVSYGIDSTPRLSTRASDPAQSIREFHRPGHSVDSGWSCDPSSSAVQ